LGGLLQAPELWPTPDGLQIGLLGHAGALAFDLLWAPDDAACRLIVDNARGSDEVGVPLGVALTLMDAAWSAAAQRSGRCYRLVDLGSLVLRSVLPAVGVRVPEASQGRVSQLRFDAQQLICSVDPALTQPLLSEHTLRRIDFCALVQRADDHLAAGDVEAARAEYLAALERAPRHPEIARQIAQIDVAVGGRNHAALGLLKETVVLRNAGALAGALLAEAGDIAGAREAFDHAVRGEPYAPLAAFWLLQLARMESEGSARLDALDRAVARAPSVAQVRRARLVARASLGEVTAVLADAQHLEAAAHGARARHEELCLAANALLEAGRLAPAGQLFERALRYLPDDPQATLGLAQAFIAAGQQRRALALLERAIALSTAKQQINIDALIELGRILAVQMGDLPQAIARVREVPSEELRASEARALEAGWLAQLGDLAGASLAYARLRQAAELHPPPNPVQVAKWLIEASRFELEQEDVFAAERHAAIALKLSPRDPQLQVEYRDVAAKLAKERRAERS